MRRGNSTHLEGNKRKKIIWVVPSLKFYESKQKFKLYSLRTFLEKDFWTSREI